MYISQWKDISSAAVHSEASRYLVEVLESVSEVELEDVIERILDAVEKQPRKNLFTQLTAHTCTWTNKQMNNCWSLFVRQCPLAW